MKRKPFSPDIDIRRIYDSFDVPVTPFDCGQICAPHNPSGKPFCCDICQAVPAAYRLEWDALKTSTGLWKVWQGNECPEDADRIVELLDETPDHMLLLACLGPDRCERENRLLSCRQFPFFPYVTSDFRFLGLTYEWEFEYTCWVISNLSQVTEAYRKEFVQTYDHLFALWQEEFDSYASLSEEMREHFSAKRRRIPLLHRSGGWYLVSPKSDRMQRVSPELLPRFGYYK
jgi:hypothetical protein